MDNTARKGNGFVATATAAFHWDPVAHFGFDKNGNMIDNSKLPAMLTIDWFEDEAAKNEPFAGRNDKETKVDPTSWSSNYYEEKKADILLKDLNSILTL